MEDVVIRELEIDDLKNGFLESLDSLKPASHLSPEESLSIFQKIKNNPFQIVFVVSKNSRIVGSATLILEQKFIHDGQCVGHIEDVVIDSKFQKSNLGTELIMTLLERAKNEGCYKCVLDCLVDISPFYEKLGFVRHLNGMRFDFRNIA